MHEFKSVVSMLDSNVYGHHLPVPLKISELYKDSDRRMICILADEIKVHCALMPKGGGEYMILLHKHLRDKLKLSLGDEVMVKLEKDESEYGMPLPEELSELWDIDPDAFDVFHTLTKGKQRSLIYQIGQG